MRHQEEHNHNKIKSCTCQVGNPQTGKNYNRRRSPKGVKVLSPTSGFPDWGVCVGGGIWQLEEESPENLALKSSRVWSQEFYRTGGNRNLPLGGLIHRVLCTPGPRGKSSDFNKRLGQPYLLVLEGLLQRQGWLWLTMGTKTMAAEVLVNTHWCEPP